ncbi:MAG TPA: hypothetical protein VGK99_00045 [Acidobacteriota bacterium]
MQPTVFRVSISRWIGDGWNLLLKDIGTFALIGLFSFVFLHFPFLAGPIWTAMAYAAVQFLERGRVTLNDYFHGYRYFLPAFLASVVIAIFATIGLIFLIIPGLVILAMYQFTFIFICQNEQDFWEAMRSSRRVVSQDSFGFTMFMLVLVLINVLGALFFYVGLVFTLPLTANALVIAHREIQGSSNAALTPAPLPTRPIIIE